MQAAAWYNQSLLCLSIASFSVLLNISHCFVHDGLGAIDTGNSRLYQVGLSGTLMFIQ
jgi:hypothetical protein